MAEIKSANIQTIREIFYTEPEPHTRPGLAKKSGLSMAASENILKGLEKNGEICCKGYAPSNGGRPSKLYHLNPDHAHIGIILLSHLDRDFTVDAACIDLGGRIVIHDILSVRNSPDTSELITFIKNIYEKDSLIKQLVVSFPGIVSFDGNIIDGDFPTLTGTNLKNYLSSELSVPVHVANDVNLAAEGYAALHPENENLAVLYQPYTDHAGAGIIIHHQIVNGGSGFAGEVGKPAADRQMKLLNENPSLLVSLLAETIISVAVPERIAWYAPMVTDTISLPDIPEICRPVLDQMSDFNELEEMIRTGAESVGRKKFMRYTK